MASSVEKSTSGLKGLCLWLGGWLGIVAIQLIVAFIMLEIAARIFDPFGISYYPETAAYLDTMIREQPIGYRNRPDLSGKFWGVDVAINSFGMRDRETTEKPAANEFRILVMGDSFPFGIGQPVEHSIPRQLEDRLNWYYHGRPSFRTLNMSVISYNTEQELIQFKTVGIKLQPQLVILFYSINDIEAKNWVLEKRRKLAEILQRSYAASLLLVLYQDARIKLTGRDNRVHLDAYQDQRPGSRWTVIENSISDMSQICKAAGIRFVIFTRFEDTRFEYRKILRQRFDSVKTRLGIPVVDLDGKSDPRWRNADPASLRNSRVDSHPTKLGAEVYATLSFEALQRLKILSLNDSDAASFSKVD
jgi:hypothetical protein